MGQEARNEESERGAMTSRLETSGLMVEYLRHIFRSFVILLLHHAVNLRRQELSIIYHMSTLNFVQLYIHTLYYWAVIGGRILLYILLNYICILSRMLHIFTAQAPYNTYTILCSC